MDNSKKWAQKITRSVLYKQYLYLAISYYKRVKRRRVRNRETGAYYFNIIRAHTFHSHTTYDARITYRNSFT